MKLEVALAMFVLTVPTLNASSSPTVVNGTVIMSALQSSAYNEDVARLAIDDDPNTCARTGLGTSNWWKVDLGQATSIAGVILTGSTVAANIRIGNQSDDLGVRHGFSNNPLCTTMVDGLPSGSPSSYRCHIKLVGRYLSIQEVDDFKISQMTLCDVRVF